MSGMSLPLVQSLSPPVRPIQPLVGELGLALSRVHEFCGPSRVALAAILMGRMRGPVLWVCPAWQGERLYPDGLSRLADPGRLIVACGRRAEDILWTAEEALRSGAVALVVADLPAPPALTPVRRLHLAAETGTEAARHAGRPPVLGVLLTAGNGGAAGVESRWRMDPAPAPSRLTGWGESWHLSRLRARTEPEAAWRLMRDETGGLALSPT
jgi:protein ImuA